jgi:hypothetical protein
MTNDDQTLSLWGKAALVLGATFVTFGLFAVGLVMPILRTAFANSPQAALVPWVATLVGPALRFPRLWRVISSKNMATGGSIFFPLSCLR